MAEAAQLRTDGLLVIDKAAGLTSHDVVARARRALATRAIGHAGTLDPAATGVLVLAVGEATKLVAYLSAEDKEYDAVVRLGATTTSLDADGEITATAAVPSDLCAATVHKALQGFVGTHAQQVPAISAVHVHGERLHRLARAGRQVELPVRQVTLHAAQLLHLAGADLHLRLHCSKGFYVRSLARDLALALGTLGHLVALRRRRAGTWTLDEATAMSTLEAAASDEEARSQLRKALVPLARACSSLRRVDLNAPGALAARHGRRLRDEDLAHLRVADLAEPTLALFDPAGDLVALAEADLLSQTLRIRRGILPPQDHGT